MRTRTPLSIASFFILHNMSHTRMDKRHEWRQGMAAFCALRSSTGAPTGITAFLRAL